MVMTMILKPSRRIAAVAALAGALVFAYAHVANAQGARVFEWVEGTPALVADLNSGQVLYSENATDPWFPASLTKMMTAYVALEEVRAGRMSMDSLLTVTPHAAARPASKMGFKAGERIRLDNALIIIMVGSANDVATTIAEGVSGSVENFVAKMNLAAARLGMHDSYFANPSGLPDARKRTSARDMALLARALWREFPGVRELYGLESIRHGSRVMRNGNGLVGRYAGTTGMKTGYVCSSGFNVVATAQRGGRDLVAIVMGAPTAIQRTAKSASLLEYGFSTFGGFGRANLETMPRSPKADPPDLRPVFCTPNGRRPLAMGESGSNRGATTNAAFAGLFGGSGGTRLPVVELPERGPPQPIRVWTGATPPGAEQAVATPPAASAGAPVSGQRPVPMPPRRPAF
ncbi:MAG: D-alanyl-D-alanine carboxypeptidase [Salinarimonadaceae bacterium]|nr:MAG: D-alanyl-D-alanine carboxypeptidase [Salinarimonadaceae bacterium]